MESTNQSTVAMAGLASDTEIVARVLSGEKELYELLMRRHNQKLYRVMRGYLTGSHDAEDAMQDTYLTAYEKLYQFRNDALFSTWLIRIGINIALGKIRNYKKSAPAAVATDTVQEMERLLSQETDFINPENIAIQKEVKLLLEKAIDCLPDKYRIIYILREVEGLSLSEVMQCLDLSESNVKVRLHRAKALLKDCLYKMSVNREVFEFGNKRCDLVVENVMKALP